MECRPKQNPQMHFDQLTGFGFGDQGQASPEFGACWCSIFQAWKGASRSLGISGGHVPQCRLRLLLGTQAQHYHSGKGAPLGDSEPMYMAGQLGTSHWSHLSPQGVLAKAPGWGRRAGLADAQSNSGALTS